MILPYHWAFAAASLQPLVLPGGHAHGFQFLPDHALLRSVLYLLQTPGGQLGGHVSASKKDQKDTAGKQPGTHNKH